ncbi:MAG: cation-translocating P-type ATPase [Cloacibacillus sp.]
METTEKYCGLTNEEAAAARAKFGANSLTEERKNSPLIKVLKFFTEPVFLLLIGAACIYFFLGEPRDGILMFVFVIFMGGINIYQEWKTDKTLAALKSLSSPKVKLIRNGAIISVPSEEVVPGDVMLLSEGERIAADARVLEADGFGVDESTLTGEADIVWKARQETGADSRHWRTDHCYAGTSVVAGRAVACVTATGLATEYGKIGKDVADAPDRPTPLEKQTRKLVRDCSIFSFVMLLFVIAATWRTGASLVESALAGITIAMATIPEEFPVVLTVFLALGAWRLAKRNALIRRIPSVETLGAVTVLCVDKTGTLTENRMTLKELTPLLGNAEKLLAETAALASETDPYDPMERAILKKAAESGIDVKKLQSHRLVHEYPFSSESRMMAHIWEIDGKKYAAAKGSPENIFKLCSLSKTQLAEAELAQQRLADAGCRVLAVARAEMKEIPDKMTDCTLSLVGLAAFIDPPRENVPASIKACADAGVRVVMITGDNSSTAHRIAHEVGLGESEEEHVMITGEELDALDESSEKFKDVTIFSRILPREKMQIVKALRARGEIVAMTGDGVNDAPALKYADIGIAMGGRGTEVAREAADMVLLDDNFSTIVSTIRDGRKIYDNIRKAMEYVMVIHFPIALSALAAPLLGLPVLLSPIHVVLLELIIDPTCSIIFEGQPAEKDIMKRPPRPVSSPIVTRAIFCKALLQGLAIFAAAFGSYYLLLGRGEDHARTFFLSVLVLSNLFLVYVNRSEKDFAFSKSAATDKVAWFVNIGILAALVVMSAVKPIAAATKLSALTFSEFILCVATAAAATLWWEGVKWMRRISERA